jgi:PPOX class probable F420-dependent enzyme
MTLNPKGRGAARAAVALAVALGGLASMVNASRAGTVSPQTQELLQSSSYIYTATERKDGGISESVPIWFMWDGEKVFFTTSPDSWKAKRIARGSPVIINVGSKNGPKLVGKATKVTDPAVIERMGQAYNDKYWIAWLGFFRPRSDRVTSGKTAAYVVDVQEQ